ncbi:MAG: hypothetical protein P0S94_00485 [Simkaniaceae bacterium]|nr:hypothetical protein [Simkaniaceae bacterium]
MKKREKILLLTSTGGSGHLKAGEAKKAQLRREDPDRDIQVKEVNTDLFGCIVGPFLISLWNRAQKQGHTHLLEIYSQLERGHELVSFIPVFCRLFARLQRKNYSRIIDVQPNYTLAIVKAIRFYNFLYRKNLYLERHFIELPTEKATDYFRPIRRLRKRDRKLVELNVSLPPFVREGQSDKEFWHKHAKLPLEQIKRHPPLLRPAFENCKINVDEPLDLIISVPNPIERLHIMQTIGRGFVPFKEKGEGIGITLSPEEKVATMMLGSQPARKATLQYINHFIELAFLSKEPITLFVFCANQNNEDMPLIEKICKQVMKNPDHPANLTIIPMPYQSDEIVAPLYARSDVTITRSGGTTSTELIALARGKIWIHSERPLKKDPEVPLFKIWGMPRWEEGNANYLKAKRGAELICTETFQLKCRTFFTAPLPEKILATL